ncbi:MAG: DUF4249 domain-containing protein [Prevotella sp.]|nr:DUF4249 domain-containing protein [Prevotella sp.]
MMKLKSLYAVLCLLAVVCTLSGCIDEYEADISSDDTNLLVVEGSICAYRLNKFYLSRTIDIKSQIPQTVTGATVYVRGTDGTEITARETNGYYACQIDALDPGVEYYLHIETDGEVYESDPQLPLRTEKIAEVTGVQNTPESSIDVLVTPAEPFEPDKTHYYSWTYDETWEVHPDYTTIWYYDTLKLAPVIKNGQFPERGWKDATGTTIMVGSSQNYEGQHIHRLKLYDIDRQNERMFYRYSGMVHQRAISRAEYEYELARRQAGSEMGGLFTPLPSALPTNIHCLTSKKHVIGFVGCALNTSDYRFFFNYKDFSIFIPQHKDTRLWVDDPTPQQCCKLVSEGYFLCEWEDAEMSSDQKTHTAWAHDYELDVRIRGAYAKEPDFWSLQENVSY